MVALPALAARQLADMVDVRCPGCDASMTALRLAAHYGRETEVDHCATCGGLWFDALESQQLTAGAVLAVLDAIATVTSPAALRRRLACLRCGATLRAVTDVQRGTRFTYHACPARHGRFITAYQFLREKHLVRELSAEERLHLRASIQQVNCVNCGGPVALAGASTCPHCRTPVSTVDPGQLRRELEVLRQRDATAGRVDPTWPISVAHERARAERAWSGTDDGSGWLLDVMREGRAGGLLASALRLLTTKIR